MPDPIKYLLICFFTAVSVHAQVFSWGAAVSATAGSVEIEQSDREVIKTEGSNINGFEAGLFIKLKGGPFYVRPMLMYNFRNGDVVYRNQNTFYRAHKIGGPLLFGINIVGPVNLEGGPVYNYVLNTTENFTGIGRRDLVRNGIGFRAGLSLEVNRLMVSLSYEGMNFSRYNDENKTSFKEPYKLILGAGIKFGGGRSGDEPIGAR